MMVSLMMLLLVLVQMCRGVSELWVVWILSGFMIVRGKR